MIRIYKAFDYNSYNYFNSFNYRETKASPRVFHYSLHKEAVFLADHRSLYLIPAERRSAGTLPNVVIMKL